MTEQPQHPTVFDSDTQHLGGVYAKALLGVTEKQGISDEVLEQFGSFLFDVMDKLPTLTSLLTSPRVSHEEKVEVMDKAFGGRMHPVLLNFLKVVSRHGRVDCLRAIHAELLKQFNSARGRVEVQVDVAAPMSDEMVAEIKERLQAALQAEVALKTRVNPDVLGGLVIRVGDTVYDGSIANQLRRLEDSALGRTRHAFRTAMDKFAVSD